VDWTTVLAALISAGLGVLGAKFLDLRASTQGNLWTEIRALRAELDNCQDETESQRQRHRAEIDLGRAAFYELQERFYSLRAEVSRARLELDLIRTRARYDCANLPALIDEIEGARQNDIDEVPSILDGVKKED
jgi:predicted nuclease with TOPRIM domain